jgi:hypothetical protein
MRFRNLIVSGISVFLFSCTSEAMKTNVVSIPITDSFASIESDRPKRIINTELDSTVKYILTIGKTLKIPSLPIGKRVVGYGKIFLGKPYVDKTLEINPESETVVCNLTGFDCVTFFENAWVFARISHLDTLASDAALVNGLRTLRYRDGKLDGYASRLHYTTDYFYNNAKRGNLKEMTSSIGGIYAVIEDKPIDFMSSHPASYKQIENNEAEWKRIEFYEREMANRGGFYYIKKENVAKIEKGIEDGDLIGITTSIPGIDCSHTGIAVRGDDGRIHLMHASLTKKKVIISDVPLADYLAGNSKQTGIIVYRPLEVEKK